MHSQNRRRFRTRPGCSLCFANHQDAIVRNLRVLCESTQRIGEPHKQRHSEIDWPSIGGMQNALVHDYLVWIFWLVITRDLAPLDKAMSGILEFLGQQR